MSAKRVEQPSFAGNEEVAVQLEKVNVKHMNRNKRWSRSKKGSRVHSTMKPRSTSGGYTFGY